MFFLEYFENKRKSTFLAAHRKTVPVLLAQLVKNLPAMWETQGSGISPGEEGDLTNLAWEIPWTEEPGGLQSMGLQESDTI